MVGITRSKVIWYILRTCLSSFADGFVVPTLPSPWATSASAWATPAFAWPPGSVPKTCYQIGSPAIATLKLLPMLPVVPPPPRRGAARICAAKGSWLFDELVTLRRRVPCQKVLRRWWSTRPMIGARDYVAVDSWQRFGTYHHWSGGCLKEHVLSVIGAIGTHEPKHVLFVQKKDIAQVAMGDKKDYVPVVAPGPPLLRLPSWRIGIATRPKSYHRHHVQRPCK